MKRITLVALLLGVQVAHADQSVQHINNFICTKHETLAQQAIKARDRNVPVHFEVAVAGGSVARNRIIQRAYDLPAVTPKDLAAQSEQFSAQVKAECLAEMMRDPVYVAQ